MSKIARGKWSFGYDGHDGLWIQAEDGTQIGYVCRGNEANARLMTAAPDLLNALAVLAAHCDKVGIPVHAARAALAKAKGEDA